MKYYLFLALLILLNVKSIPATAQEELLNKPAPNFILTDITGKSYSLSALKGKVIVLNFWFIACKPCVTEMAMLNAISAKYKIRKVVFLALSSDKKEAIQNFLKTQEFSYILFPEGAKIADSYQVYAYPTSMVIDSQGIIRFIQIGGPDIGHTLPVAIEAAISVPMVKLR